ncbi:hypothetical protein VaNZ11_012968 [Volvox africanus]|uniref:THUMP domain-containing protein n=1 Tax=Volvox africanus TaxID=51714 RepID=A0ABQ5SF48_9CHLO|nr:hypothetical protein VaNZ11_012968 [Volvox africanus]
MGSRHNFADGGDLLERLRREAETEMRRVLDESRPRKRPRGDEDSLLAPIERYRYAVGQELEAGAKGFIITCNFQREKSATREASQLLRRYMPEHLFQLPLEPQGGRVQSAGPSGQARSGSGSGPSCYEGFGTTGGGSAGGDPNAGSTSRNCDGDDACGDGDDNCHNGDSGDLLGLGKEQDRGAGDAPGDGDDGLAQEDGLGCDRKGAKGGAAAWAEGAADREGGDREPSALGLAKVACRGVVLIRLSTAAAAEVDPVAVVDSMLADLKTGSLKPPRHCQRIIPLDATCRLTPTGLSAAVAAAAAAFKRRYQQQPKGDGSAGGPDPAALEPPQFSFAIGYRSRMTDAPAPSAPAPPAAVLSSLREGAPSADGAGNVADTAAQRGEQQSMARHHHQQLQQLTQEQKQEEQQKQDHGTRGEGLFERSQILSLVAAGMVEAFGGACTVNLKKPQVAVLVEAVPVADRQFAGVTLLPEHMFVSKSKLVIKPLVTNARA